VGKVRITIRCAKCYNVETQDIEAWAAVKTTCGCNGPYRVLSREGRPDEPQAEAKEKKGSGEKGPKSSAAPAPESAGAPENQDSAG
jgi:hypothetical protein